MASPFKSGALAIVISFTFASIPVTSAHADGDSGGDWEKVDDPVLEIPRVCDTNTDVVYCRPVSRSDSSEDATPEPKREHRHAAAAPASNSDDSGIDTSYDGPGWAVMEDDANAGAVSPVPAALFPHRNWSYAGQFPSHPHSYVSPSGAPGLPSSPVGIVPAGWH
ncbi:MAG TPA: hypothetical protein VMT58_04165 [Candidatus Binataceae bacterium]|nr:hypothetical protein [Candidatus Binataceae bacterium]